MTGRGRLKKGKTDKRPRPESVARIKLDRKCPVCGSRLDFVEEKDGVYMTCKRCRIGVYVPAESAAEYATDFPTLIELMTEELAYMARKVKQKKGGFRTRRAG